MVDTPKQSLKCCQAVARALKDNDVDIIFGLIGDANMFSMDSFVHDWGGQFVAAAHEAGGALMALGFAAMSGKVGVCSVTHGPAMTNTVTALVEGVKGSIPMVLLCGDTAMEDRENNQNVSQRDIIVATGAGFEQLRSPATVVQDVARVLRRAAAERRPIALNMPSDFDFKDVDYQPIRVVVPERRAIVSESDDLDNAIGIIAAAKRPVILAGRGATSLEAKNALLELAKRLEAPLATTLKAKDLFRGEDFNLGICGTVSTAAAVDTLIESDCIIAFGASLNYRTTSHGTFIKGKRVIQINLEIAEIGKNFAPHAGLVGDPAGMAKLIIHWLDEAEIPPSGWWTSELKERLAAPPSDTGEPKHQERGTVDYARALAKLEPMLPEDRVFVTDGGRFMLHAWNAIKTAGPSSFMALVDFGSIGLGFSSAIGASFAAPGRSVVLVTGDGGFMHGGLAEFSTAVRYKVPLIVIACNDSAYGAELMKFANKFSDRKMDPGLITFEWPDFATAAIALGGRGVTVRSESDWILVKDAIQNNIRPLLIDLKVDPTRVPLV